MASAPPARSTRNSLALSSTTIGLRVGRTTSLTIGVSVDTRPTTQRRPRRPFRSVASTPLRASTPGGAVRYGVEKEAVFSRSAVGVTCEIPISAPPSRPVVTCANGACTTCTRFNPSFCARARARPASSPDRAPGPNQKPGAGTNEVATVNTPVLLRDELRSGRPVTRSRTPKRAAPWMTSATAAQTITPSAPA